MAKTQKVTNHSLYRYAGGKNRMKKDLIKIIRDVNPGIEYLVSPFWGGGSTEMLIASEGVKVQGYDVFRPLADFWEIVCGDGGAAILADMAEQHYPLIDSDHYKTFLPGLDSEDKWERALSFYIAIKGSYSGKIGCSTVRSRAEFRLVGIDKLRNFYAPNVTFCHGSCFDTIPAHENDFLYLDPPYYETVSHYYGKDGALHKSFDHEKFCETLKQHKGGFVMSYDNSDSVRALYDGWTEFRYLTFPYQMSGTKRYDKTELVIVKYPEKVKPKVTPLEAFMV
jgi:DNA adenine methylase